MSKTVFTTNDLSKKYGDVYALNNVSINLCKGQICGLIGKNGAGKTTLMRLIAGLIFPTSGSLELFGCSQEQEIRKVRSKAGFMIESPSINTSMTAKENLALQGIIKGVSNSKQENDLLTLVGLDHTGRKKARNFSLGMKQRLGIALALLGNPEFLVLDEPINGLDPVGVIEVRNLLIKLCKDRNIAILISSHNLPELYQLATKYIIIDKGEIKQELTLVELEKKCRHFLLLRTNQSEHAIALLKQELNIKDYVIMKDKSIRLYDAVDRVEEVATILQKNNILVTTISVEGETLENYFLSLIGGNNNEKAH